jgi:hypothetical protein
VEGECRAKQNKIKNIIVGNREKERKNDKIKK